MLNMSKSSNSLVLGIRRVIAITYEIELGIIYIICIQIKPSIMRYDNATKGEGVDAQ